MKLKTQEKMRQIEIDVYIATIFISLLLTRDLDVFKVINTFLESNNMNLEDIRSLTSGVLCLDIVTSYRREQYTSEYKELKGLYSDVVSNIAELLKGFEFENPVSIFAAYMYMYRNGYLSHNKYFTYSTNMKDFSYLNGLDVIRGEGVCRSIGSLLTDIYKEMGLDSHNLLVRVKKRSFDSLEDLCSVPMNKTEKGNKFANIVGNLTTFLPLSNHLITDVEYNGKNYILDSTNDIYLYNEKGKLILPNGKFWKESRLTSIVTTTVGQININLNFIKKYKQFNLPSISNEEYRKIYLQALNLIKDNIDILEKFYSDNRGLFDEIKILSDKQNNFIKRIFPMV